MHPEKDIESGLGTREDEKITRFQKVRTFFTLSEIQKIALLLNFSRL